jgi:triosephosphate isomerase (TIM)
MSSLIFANWKCNPDTLDEAKKLFKDIAKGIKGTKNGVIICPPFLYLPELVNSVKKNPSNIEFGAQDCFWVEGGPYTGEVSSTILKDSGVKYVIVGHSERRTHFNETDEMINKKLKSALSVGLTPVLCVGEKKGDSANQVIENQLNKDLDGIDAEGLKRVVVAYEPVWAIGTGEFCDPVKAAETLKFIKSKIKSFALYGGSVNSKIAKDYINVGYNGLLVGGASLKPEEFINIVKNVEA